MRIRPADATDTPAVARIVRDAYTMYIARIGKPPGPMLDDYAALIRSHCVWVAGAPVAGLIVLLPEADHLLLDNIAVDPAAQGTGIGRALMQFADAEAARRGYAELRLYTHLMMTENIALYARTGWTETGRGEQNGFSRVFFRKRL
ncbi:MAG: GNAT family N-acetyltransferase [Acetobacteraceae bacterium]|nr:GNAT family N-acetyltransferase [Acetobacteraceae bacterium]